MDKEYDVIIIGGGPTGLAAGLYASRARLETLLIEKAVSGGQIATTSIVENYPGFPEGVDGYELGQLMEEQARKYGTEILAAEVTDVELDGLLRIVKTTEGDFRAPVVIVTSGAEHRKLGVEGEARLTGYGVSYCATCDGAFFKDAVVAVVGGGDAALDEGLFLTRYASKVIVIHRRDQLRASKILQERALENPKMEFLWDTVVEEVVGDDKVKSLRLRNVKTGRESTLDVEGVFIYIGLSPNTDFLKSIMTLDGGGHVPVNLWMETEVPGVFAAGDARCEAARQVVSAAGDGATAAIAADRYLSEIRAELKKGVTVSAG